MNFQNTNKPLKVVISVGDESGIGPEIILKALCSNEIPENIEFKLVGSKKNLQNTYEHLKSLGLKTLANPKNLKIHDLEIASPNNDSIITSPSDGFIQNHWLNNLTLNSSETSFKLKGITSIHVFEIRTNPC